MGQPPLSERAINLGNALLNLLLSLSLVGGNAVAPAAPQINTNVRVAPPAAQVEVLPAIPSGHVWAPGYWGWNGEQHFWVRGRPIAQQEGYRWQPDRWEERNRKYYRIAGNWEPDNS